jgi:hypothetical protein
MLLVHKDLQVQQDTRAMTEISVLKDQQVQEVLQDHKVILVLQDQEVLLVLQAQFKDQQVLKESRVYKENVGYRDYVEKLEHRE